eukprot:TRINITY_DN10469_c0_g1_i2.p2 TRINITY_DN10469_c0_g1~~TRINITY_DN10469_c0_g1_i2.p2  ORF type:complete len:103 (-),score=15.60 TRINITY_DN10469_c0_g1_i2:266-574(-)
MMGITTIKLSSFTWSSWLNCLSEGGGESEGLPSSGHAELGVVVESIHATWDQARPNMLAMALCWTCPALAVIICLALLALWKEAPHKVSLQSILPGDNMIII